MGLSLSSTSLFMEHCSSWLKDLCRIWYLSCASLRYSFSFMSCMFYSLISRRSGSSSPVSLFLTDISCNSLACSSRSLDSSLLCYYYMSSSSSSSYFFYSDIIESWAFCLNICCFWWFWICWSFKAIFCSSYLFRWSNLSFSYFSIIISSLKFSSSRSFGISGISNFFWLV